MLENSFGIGMIFGPAIGGFLSEWYGFPFPFLVMGITTLVSSIIGVFAVTIECEYFATVREKVKFTIESTFVF